MSIFIFILETEDTIYYQFQTFFNYINFLFAIIFSIEYLARLYLIGFHYDYNGFWGRVRYFFSWHSIVDLLAIIPLYISGITHDSFLLRILRVLRLLVFAKLGRYSKAMMSYKRAISKRRHELEISFVLSVLLMILSSTVLC